MNTGRAKTAGSAAGADAAEEVEPLVDGRPDLSMVVYDPTTPQDVEKIRRSSGSPPVVQAAV